MTVTIHEVAPEDIENESFKIIEKELGPHSFSDYEFRIAQRTIHATGDFSFAENIRFSENAIEHGIAALRAGKSILTDVTMAASGISKAQLKIFGGTVICRIGDQEVAAQAKIEGTTRAEMAMRMGLSEDIGIIAIGNAPTALIEVVNLLQNKSKDATPLIIGVPVGFVNAAESKDLLHESTLHHITCLGRKGGSPVAASIVNALLRIAA